MIFGDTPPNGDRFLWVRDGWVADRWPFVFVCTVTASCMISVWVGGVVVVLNHQPPLGVWILGSAYVLTQVWRRHISHDKVDAADDVGGIETG